MDHNYLVERAAKWLRNSQRCRVVATELHAGDTLEIPDAIGWKYDGTSILVECKVSVSDFKHDKYKEARKAAAELGVGKIRVYFVSKEVAKYLQPKDIPEGWGLYVVGAKQVRKKVEATPQVLSAESVRREMVMLGTLVATEKRAPTQDIAKLNAVDGRLYLAQARRNHITNIQRFANHVRETLLIPFCDEQHTKFYGTRNKTKWHFVTRTNEKLYVQQELLNSESSVLTTMPRPGEGAVTVLQESQLLVAMLLLKVYGAGEGKTLGDYVEKYLPTRKKV